MASEEMWHRVGEDNFAELLADAHARGLHLVPGEPRHEVRDGQSWQVWTLGSDPHFGSPRHLLLYREVDHWEFALAFSGGLSSGRLYEPGKEATEPVEVPASATPEHAQAVLVTEAERHADQSFNVRWTVGEVSGRWVGEALPVVE